jgi:hypothetical protein
MSSHNTGIHHVKPDNPDSRGYIGVYPLRMNLTACVKEAT